MQGPGPGGPLEDYQVKRGKIPIRNLVQGVFLAFFIIAAEVLQHDHVPKILAPLPEQAGDVRGGV
jgi:hypothetical protein